MIETLEQSQVVYGRGVSPLGAASDLSRVLERFADLLSLERPEWYVLTLSGEAQSADKIGLVSHGFSALDDSAGTDDDQRLVVCLLNPEQISRAEWSKIKEFHALLGRPGSPIFIGHAVNLPLTASPVWLDKDIMRAGSYIVDKFLFHALVEQD